MTAREDRIPMTVAQIREALAGLPDDVVPTWSSWDSEYDHTYIYGIEAITPEGRIESVLTDGFSGWGDDEDDGEDWEESEAEQVTAGAESAEALYHDEYSPDGDPDAYGADVKAILTEGAAVSKQFPKGFPDGYID